MIADRRCFVLVTMLAACGDEPRDGDGRSTKAAVAERDGEPAEASAKQDDAPAKAPAPAPMSMPPSQDVCRGFDDDAVAAALGWGRIAKVSASTGTRRGVRQRECNYVGDKTSAERRFRAAFALTKDLDPQHFGLGAVYESHADIAGKKAQIARTDRVVVLQIAMKDFLVTLDVSEKDVSVDELQPKLEVAAVALIGSLREDAKAIIDPQPPSKDEGKAGPRDAKAPGKAAAGKAPAKVPAKSAG